MGSRRPRPPQPKDPYGRFHRPGTPIKPPPVRAPAGTPGGGRFITPPPGPRVPPGTETPREGSDTPIIWNARIGWITEREVVDVMYLIAGREYLTGRENDVRETLRALARVDRALMERWIYEIVAPEARHDVWTELMTTSPVYEAL